MERRGLLLGLGAAVGAAASGAPVPGASAASEGSRSGAPPGRSDVQAGVVTPQQPTALVVAFDVLAGSRADLARLFDVLAERIAFLTAGGRVPDLDPGLPPADSGVLGPVVFTPDLTITVSIGASLFDDRFGLSDRRPRHLTAMPRFGNDAPDPAASHGDLLLQICSASAEANIHALRDVLRATPDLLAPRWKIEGFLRTPTDRAGRPETPRNLMGFKDGSGNLDASDAALMDRLIWVGAGGGEPDWAVGGSYQVVRVIRMLVERWDRTPLREQETIIGRHKVSGAPLGSAREHDTPDYAKVPVDAHIRLANPRTPQTEASRILRRGYNFSRGLTAAGQLDMGLLFICYQNDLAAGFGTVQARLNGEPLEEYIKPVGGGYFFVLPAGARPGGRAVATLGGGLLSG